MNSNERKITSKEIIDRYIGALEDDLQHYTMVDKDSVKAKLIQFELKEYKQIKQDLDRLEEFEKELKDGTLSDGYHTFNDLYLQRMYLFATIVNQNKEYAWKSLKHEDGELCFGGDWFIVGIDTPRGSYTYHYETNYWSLFDCQELEVAKHWDGHTSKDVDRLLSLDIQLETKISRLEDYKINYQTAIAFMQAQKEEMKKEREENAKLKKALDILISKKVDVNHLKRTKDFNGCNRTRHFYEADYLMEEEYKLLKDILDCE